MTARCPECEKSHPHGITCELAYWVVCHHWILCQPCYDHLAQHFRNLTEPWNKDVKFTRDKEECLLDKTGCIFCKKSHESVLKGPPPDDPCDKEFVEKIST